MIGALRSGFEQVRAFGFFSREVRGMHAAAYILGFSALLSSLLALFRDRLLAHTFGAGLELDLYYAAFRIPDLLFVASGALVSAYVLIPVLAAKDDEAQRRYIDAVVVGFGALAVGLSGIAAIFAPVILSWLFPTFAGALFPTLVSVTRILLLQPILLGFSNILGAVTQSHHRYVLYAIAPILYNLGIIVGVIFLYPLFGLSGIAWGVVLGAALHAAIQLPAVVRDGFLKTVSLRFRVRDLFDTVRISIPRALALSINQVAFLGLLIIASDLTTGSISIFMFAFNLQAVPLAIIGASYSVAAFPTLARLSQSGSSEFMGYVGAAARHMFFWSLPTLMLIITLRAHIVRVVLGTGEFSWTDTRLTSAALALFIISLTAQSLMLLLVRAYYASGRTMIPLAVSCMSALSIIFFALALREAFGDPGSLLFLESLLRVEFLRGTEILALPLAYSLAILFGATVLAAHFEFLNRGFFASVADSLWESITAAFAGAVAAYGTLAVLGTVTFSSTLASVLLRGGVAGLVGLMAAAIVYALMGSREFSETVQSLTRRIWRDVEPVSSAEATDVSRA